MLCAPRPRLVSDFGELQAAKLPPSTEQLKVEPESLENETDSVDFHVLPLGAITLGLAGGPKIVQL